MAFTPEFVLLSLILHTLSVDTMAPPPPPPPPKPPVGAFNCIGCWGKPECPDESFTAICFQNQCKTVITNLVGAGPSTSKSCNSVSNSPLGCSTKDMGGGSNMTTCICATNLCNQKGFGTVAGGAQPPPQTTTTSNGIGGAGGTNVAAGSGTGTQAKLGNGGETVNPTFLISAILIFLLRLAA